MQCRRLRLSAGLMQLLTKIGLIGATLQPHALLSALYQEVADQFVGEVATCGTITALRRNIRGIILPDTFTTFFLLSNKENNSKWY